MPLPTPNICIIEIGILSPTFTISFQSRELIILEWKLKFYFSIVILKKVKKILESSFLAGNFVEHIGESAG